LQIDLLPEIVEAPCILSEVDAALKAKQMKNDVDEYLTVMGTPDSSIYLYSLWYSWDYIKRYSYNFSAVEAAKFNFPKWVEDKVTSIVQRG